MKEVTDTSIDNSEDEVEEILDLCQHYWVIESPQGPVSIGTCKHCDKKQEFWNSMPNTGWERKKDMVKTPERQT